MAGRQNGPRASKQLYAPQPRTARETEKSKGENDIKKTCINIFDSNSNSKPVVTGVMDKKYHYQQVFFFYLVICYLNCNIRDIFQNVLLECRSTTRLHQTTLLRPALNSRVQSYTAPYCTSLYCILCSALTLLHCDALHYTALYCTALNCTVLHCTKLHCVVV